MTTKIERGRDPEQHVVHVTAAAADAYTGKLGQITLVQGDDGMAALRAHDGRTAGGTVLPAVPAGSLQAMLPARVAIPAVAAVVPADGILVVNHNLGYNPLVQVLSDTGTQLFPTIVHDDLENLSLLDLAPGSVTVILA